MTWPLTSNSIFPNKSQSFSIVWEDNTNHTNKRHKTDATRSSTTNRSTCRTSNGVVALSSLSSPSSLPRSPLPPRDTPVTSPAHTTGIFAGIPSRPGDLVDDLTRSGSFVFLNKLFDTDRLMCGTLGFPLPFVAFCR